MCFNHNQLWLGENNMENNRPDPDKLLEQVKEEESRINQGKLKIFSDMQQEWEKPMRCWSGRTDGRSGGRRGCRVY